MSFTYGGAWAKDSFSVPLLWFARGAGCRRTGVVMEEMTFLCGFKSAGRVVSDWPICKIIMIRLRQKALLH